MHPLCVTVCCVFWTRIWTRHYVSFFSGNTNERHDNQTWYTGHVIWTRQRLVPHNPRDISITTLSRFLDQHWPSILYDLMPLDFFLRIFAFYRLGLIRLNVCRNGHREILLYKYVPANPFTQNAIRRVHKCFPVRKFTGFNNQSMFAMKINSCVCVKILIHATYASQFVHIFPRTWERQGLTKRNLKNLPPYDRRIITRYGNKTS